MLENKIWVKCQEINLEKPAGVAHEELCQVKEGALRPVNTGWEPCSEFSQGHFTVKLNVKMQFSGWVEDRLEEVNNEGRESN